MATEAQILPTRNPQLATRTIYPINQFESIMQNKPNLPAPQMNVSSVLTKDYENDNTFRPPENKPNSKPILSAIALAKAEQTQFPKCQKWT